MFVKNRSCLKHELKSADNIRIYWCFSKRDRLKSVQSHFLWDCNYQVSRDTLQYPRQTMLSLITFCTKEPLNKVTDTTQSFSLPAIQPTQTKHGFTRLLAVLLVVWSGFSVCKRIYLIIILTSNNILKYLYN